jgi:hypothetical protein
LPAESNSSLIREASGKHAELILKSSLRVLRGDTQFTTKDEGHEEKTRIGKKGWTTDFADFTDGKGNGQAARRGCLAHRIAEKDGEKWNGKWREKLDLEGRGNEPRISQRGKAATNNSGHQTTKRTKGTKRRPE